MTILSGKKHRQTTATLVEIMLHIKQKLWISNSQLNQESIVYLQQHQQNMQRNNTYLT